MNISTIIQIISAIAPILSVVLFFIKVGKFQGRTEALLNNQKQRIENHEKEIQTLATTTNNCLKTIMNLIGKIDERSKLNADLIKMILEKLDKQC